MLRSWAPVKAPPPGSPSRISPSRIVLVGGLEMLPRRIVWLRCGPTDSKTTGVVGQHLGRRRTVPVHVALPLLALPEGPRHPVRNLRRGPGGRLPVERPGAGRALGVVARLLPLLLHTLRLRRAGRSVAGPRLPARRL